MANGQQEEASLFRALVKAFGPTIMIVWPLFFLEHFALIVNSVVLGLLLETFNDPCDETGESTDTTTTTPVANATTAVSDCATPDRTLSWVYAILMVFLTAIIGFTHHEYFFVGWRIGLNLRSAATGFIFRKALKLDVAALQVRHLCNVALCFLSVWRMICCHANLRCWWHR